MNVRYWILLGIVVVIGIIIFIAQTNVPDIDQPDEVLAMLAASDKNEEQAISADANENSQISTSDTTMSNHTDSPLAEGDVFKNDIPVEDSPKERDAAAGSAAGGSEVTASEVTGTEKEPNSYDVLLKTTDGQITELQSSCQGELFNIYIQYIGASEKAEKQRLVAQGKDELARCDASFEGIMNSLEVTLTSNQLPTTIISAYRTEYANQKELAQSMLE